MSRTISQKIDEIKATVETLVAENTRLRETLLIFAREGEDMFDLFDGYIDELSEMKDNDVLELLYKKALGYDERIELEETSSTSGTRFNDDWEDGYKHARKTLTKTNAAQEKENARLREALRRVVKEARRQHSLVVYAADNVALEPYAAGPWHYTLERPPKENVRYLVKCVKPEIVTIAEWTKMGWVSSALTRYSKVIFWAEIREPNGEER